MLDPATENTFYFDPNYTISSQNNVSTPPLWRQNNYRSLSPESKARAVERGQRELMDMVATMPEDCFELSLRDMVEKPCADHNPNQYSQQHNLNLVENSKEIAMKKTSECNISNSSEVTCGNRTQDKDWWKRKIPILEDRHTITGTSKTSTTRHGRRSIFPSFCSFIRPKKSEHPQHKNRLQEL